MDISALTIISGLTWDWSTTVNSRATGIGLGYHDIFDRKYTEKDKVIPYLNASLNWIVKCGKHLDFVLSPAIIICPSEFDWSFVQLGGDTDINPWLTNFYGLSLGIGYRF